MAEAGGQHFGFKGLHVQDPDGPAGGVPGNDIFIMWVLSLKLLLH